MTKEMLSLGSFCITPTESRSFSLMSGDYNPLHVDPVAARGSQFGATLIHGVHSTLLALDSFFENQQQSISLSSLRVSFIKPVRHGDMIECLVDKVTAESAHIEVRCQGKRVQTIDFCFSSTPRSRANVEPSSIPEDKELPVAKQVSMDEADGLGGSVPLVWNPTLFAELFPQLARLISDSQSATILGTTKIVGMICPGLNAIYTGFNLSFKAESNGSASPLNYNVVCTDPRFSRIVMAIHNLTSVGEIEAFLRPSPSK